MKKIGIQLLPLCLWCILIFMMSHQVAEESSELSSSVGMFIGRLLVPGFDGFSLEEQFLYADGIQFYVRKAAHITEYAILGILMARAIYNLGLWRERMEWWYSAFICAVLYAMSDEVHQLFIQGRTGKVTDVMIDSIGIVIGIVVYFIIIKFNTRKMSK